MNCVGTVSSSCSFAESPDLSVKGIKKDFKICKIRNAYVLDVGVATLTRVDVISLCTRVQIILPAI